MSECVVLDAFVRPSFSAALRHPTDAADDLAECDVLVCEVR